MATGTPDAIGDMSSAANSLASVHVFAMLPLDRTRLTEALGNVGFSAALGFEITRSQEALVCDDDRAIIPDGSLIIVDEASFGDAQRLLQARVHDLSSLYLVVLAGTAEATSFAERAASIHGGIHPAYQNVTVLPADVDEELIASEAATLVERHRTDPSGVLLWMIDDEPARFGDEGCWARLAAVAHSSTTPTGQVRVVRSLVGEDMLAGAARRTELVSLWRERILEPAASRGTRVVIVADNQFSERDTHLGEAWAASVAQRLPRAHVFVASILDINLARPRNVQGIWIGEGGQLSALDVDRILITLKTPTELAPEPATSARAPDAHLTLNRVRALALSNPAFRDVWSELCGFRIFWHQFSGNSGTGTILWDGGVEFQVLRAS